MSSKYQVQKLYYNSTAGYVCYPKVVSNDRTWDSRSASNWTHWTLDVDGNETVDLISDAGFSVGDIIVPAIDVVAGEDASSNTILVVAQNGQTATFTASGTILHSSLPYEGTH